MAEGKGQLSLRITPALPGQVESPVACELCVRERLRTLEGIRDLHIAREDDGLQVTVDYEPSVTTAGRLRDELRCVEGTQRLAGDRPRRAGTDTDTGTDTGTGTLSVVVPVEGMRSTACEVAIEHRLSHCPGVAAAACYAAGKVRVDFDPQATAWPRIEQAIESLGYRVIADEAVPPLDRPQPAGRGLFTTGIFTTGVIHTRRMARLARRYVDLTLVGIGGSFLLAGWSVYLTDGPFAWRVTLLALAAILCSTETIQHAWHAIRRVQLDVDVLMFAAAIGAALLGHYEEGAFLLFLFGLGHAGEDMALDRARSAIESLGELTPETAAILADDGRVQECAIEDVRVGQRVLVRPFDRLPVDGRILQGASAIDQASITGESIPVDKAVGDDVFTGTMNGEGRLVVEVTKRADETTLARVIRMVEEAQTTKSPTQLFTERIEKRYVPVVFIATGVLVVLPPLLTLTQWVDLAPRMGNGSLWGGWFYQAMAFLTAASPCALAIGTPAAVLCGIARAARVGVLVKGGGYLELMGRIRAIAFDKTGTLTVGRPVLSRIVALQGQTTCDDDVLRLAAAVERQITHPLAESIAREAHRRSLPLERADHVRQVAGFGAIGEIDGRTIGVGKPERDGHELPDALRQQVAALREQGDTVVMVTRDHTPVGLLALRDEPRDTSRPTLDRLRQLGIEHVAMLTGDHPAAAQAIAAELGVDACHADLLPEQKVEKINAMIEQFGRVAMVGDGVNDAPALAHASLGIAMGAAGADVAMETADVVLMGSDLPRLPEAIGLSRFSRRIIKQNMVIALGVIGVVAPLAAMGFAHLGLAVLLHEGSTVVFVLNALRLLRYRA